MRRNLVITLCLIGALAFIAAAPLQAAEKENGDLKNFLNGQYSLIGKGPGSNETYSGAVSIKTHGRKLEVIRCVGNQRFVGTGSIVPITGDRVPNLKVHWREGKDDYEALYMIHADADNYGRLSGPYVRTNNKDERFGWELLYVDPDNAITCK
ncbi:MAG: hypothetical protein ABFD12_05545 [Syntrophorhabdus sp.]